MIFTETSLNGHKLTIHRPVITIFTFKTEEEAITRANATEV